MRIFIWLVRAAVFFTLFAFALNNQHDASVRWFFGYEWHTSMVFVVLAAFGLGCGFGVFAMVPSWWRHRRVARKHSSVVTDATELELAPAVAESVLTHPPRDGL